MRGARRWAPSTLHVCSAPPHAGRLAGVSRPGPGHPQGLLLPREVVTAQRAWPDPDSSANLGPFGKLPKSQCPHAGTPSKGVRIMGDHPREGPGVQKGSVRGRFHCPSGARLPDTTLPSSSHSPARSLGLALRSLPDPRLLTALWLLPRLHSALLSPAGYPWRTRGCEG